MNIEKDLRKAKDGRWILLIGGKPNDSDKESPRWPSITPARWIHAGRTGLWVTMFNEEWKRPIGFLETNILISIPDLDLIEMEIKKLFFVKGNY